jgi:hypothetical protein
METFRIVIVIAIVEENKKWSCCHKNKHDLMKSNDFYILKNSFGDPCPKYEKYDMH